MVVGNPYVAGPSVGKSPSFVGRADIIREVIRTLKHPQQKALLLFGQRRIGKTSVLEHLNITLASQGLYFPVYFDLHDHAESSVGQLLSDLSRQIIHDLNLQLPHLKEENAEKEFHKDFLDKLQSQMPNGSCIILLLDEFDVLDEGRKGRASEKFFPYLRGLLSDNSQFLQFIFVIGRMQDDLTNVVHSVFKEVRAYPVSLLSFKDTEELIRLSETNKSLFWQKAAVERVYSLTGGHPLLTQYLCDEIWENHSTARSDSETPSVEANQVDLYVHHVLYSARQALDWLWEGLGPSERIVASALASIGPGKIDKEELYQNLQENGVRFVLRELENAPIVLEKLDLILGDEKGKLSFRVELLRQWITQRNPLHRVSYEIDNIEPVANNLYDSALTFYNQNKFQQAAEWLRQAIGINPQHRKSHQLLGDIYLAQENLQEARKLFENLYQIDPRVAKGRLTQVLTLQSSKTQNEDETIELYERILNIDPSHRETLKMYQELLVLRGERIIKACIKGNVPPDIEVRIQKIISAISKTGENIRVKSLRNRLRQEIVKSKCEEIKQLESQYRYTDALDIAKELHRNYGDQEGKLPDLKILNAKAKINDLYVSAERSLQQKDYDNARATLISIINVVPEYKDSILYLFEAVKGESIIQSFDLLKAQITYFKTDLNEKQNIIETFKKNELDLMLSKQKIERQAAHLNAAREEIGSRRKELDKAQKELERRISAYKDEEKRAELARKRKYDGYILNILFLCLSLLIYYISIHS